MNDLDTSARADALRAINEAGEDGLWLVRNVDSDRIRELSKADLDLARHAEGIGIYRRSAKTVGSDSGDIGEIIAQETVLKRHKEAGHRLGPDGRQKGIEFSFDDGTEVELDHVEVDREGKMTKVFETKIGSGKADQADGEIQRHLATIMRKDDVESNWEGISKEDIEVNLFTDQNKMKSVGPVGNGYDIEIKYTSEELRQMYQTARSLEEG